MAEVHVREIISKISKIILNINILQQKEVEKGMKSKKFRISSPPLQVKTQLQHDEDTMYMIGLFQKYQTIYQIYNVHMSHNSIHSRAHLSTNEK